MPQTKIAAKVFDFSGQVRSGWLLLFLSTSGGVDLLSEKHQGQVIWYGGAKFPDLKARLGAKDSPQSGPKTGGMPFPHKP